MADRRATIDIAVDGGDWPSLPVLTRLASAAMDATRAAAPDFPPAADVSVLFTNDALMAELNERWRGKEGPTNVLSFPAAASQFAASGSAPLGDIALGFETVTKEAAASDLTLADHISHLLVHGLLHLVGYDHDDDEEAAAMEALEVAILAKLGIADPYAGSEPELIGTAGDRG
jgi:probable rRNA maturation factor